MSDLRSHAPDNIKSPSYGDDPVPQYYSMLISHVT